MTTQMNTYRVGISIPDGPTMGWNEGGETTIQANTPEEAILLAREWAADGDYGDDEEDDEAVSIMLTAVNAAHSDDRGTRVYSLADLLTESA